MDQISGLNDSKKLSEKKPAKLFPQIIEKALAKYSQCKIHRTSYKPIRESIKK